MRKIINFEKGSDINLFRRAVLSIYVRLKLCNKGRNDGIRFIFLTDTHWGENDKLSPLICEYIIKSRYTNTIIFGGDFITHVEKTKKNAINLGRQFRESFNIKNASFFPTVGNHDDNSYEQEKKSEILTLKEIKSICYISSIGDIIIQGGVDNAYYIDNLKCKIRYIFLNTSKSKYYLNQIPFLCDVLSSTKSDWRIIIIGHIWLEWDVSKQQHIVNEYNQKYIDIADCYNNRKIYKNYDFLESRGRIIMILGGHIHVDKVAYSSSGIPIVITDSDAYGKSYSHVKCSKYSLKRQCVTLFDIDEEKIRLIRFGRKNKYFCPLIKLEM